MMLTRNMFLECVSSNNHSMKNNLILRHLKLNKPENFCLLTADFLNPVTGYVILSIQMYNLELFTLGLHR